MATKKYITTIKMSSGLVICKQRKRECGACCEHSELHSTKHECNSKCDYLNKKTTCTQLKRDIFGSSVIIDDYIFDDMKSQQLPMMLHKFTKLGKTYIVDSETYQSMLENGEIPIDTVITSLEVGGVRQSRVIKVPPQKSKFSVTSVL